MILADRYRDGHLKQVIDHNEGGFYGGYGAGLVFKLLFYDPQLEAREPGDLPPSREFGREVYLRSGWSPDATFLTFVSGFTGVYHNHLDENSFTLFRGADLATDGGYSLAEPYHDNYFRRTIAHNAITVFDPAECWRDTDAACTLSNDGGQRWPLRRFNPPFSTLEFGINRLWSGAILDNPMYREQFVTADRKVAFQQEFDYIDSDATKAYSNQWSGQGSNTGRRVSLARRELLFLKPDVVVILDRVTSTRADLRKAWLLHTVNAPSVKQGNRWDQAEPGVHDWAGGRDVMVQNGPARLLVRSLLPPQSKLTVIGGPGFEGWVNGENYWTSEVDQVPGVGKWRIEVSPALPAQADLFLNVLSIAAPGGQPAEDISAIETPSVVGALVGQDGTKTAVVFLRDRLLAGEPVYSVGVPARHVVMNLLPGTYDIYCNAKRLAEAEASAAGCLSFRGPAGSYRISLHGKQ